MLLCEDFVYTSAPKPIDSKVNTIIKSLEGAVQLQTKYFVWFFYASKTCQKAEWS